MFIKVLLLISCVSVKGLYRGDECVKDNVTGTCEYAWRCQSAINDIRDGKHPQLCSFEGRDVIVCCVENQTQTASTEGTTPQDHVTATTTTTQRPATTTKRPTDDYDYEYEYPDYNNLHCEPLPTIWTTAKTGKKAFDKCLEYQDQLVYPCELEPVLIARIGRVNKCHHSTDEVVTGDSAASHEFPHMVMVGFGEELGVKWLCGGSIISNTFVLTAAHCAAAPNIGSASYIAVGVLTLNDTADVSKLYKVKRVVKHPNYRPPKHYNDIALIETEIPIKLDQYTVPACVDTGDFAHDGRATVTGWGLSENSTKEGLLEKMTLNQVSRENCSMQYPVTRRLTQGFDGDTQSCYGDRNVVKDTCKGDSGAPLQIKSREINCMYVVVGVTSFGGACGSAGEAGLYTRVQHYVPWIESVVWPDVKF